MTCCLNSFVGYIFILCDLERHARDFSKKPSPAATDSKNSVNKVFLPLNSKEAKSGFYLPCE